MNRTGESFCYTCPDLATTVQEAAEDSTNCVCSEGYFGDVYSGGICLSCSLDNEMAAGVSCPVNSTLPVIGAGYFRSSDDPRIAYECVPQESCAITEQSEFTVCRKGYEGWLCGECSSGFYRNDEECSECPGKLLKYMSLFILSLAFYFALHRTLVTFGSVPRVARVSIKWIQIFESLHGLRI